KTHQGAAFLALMFMEITGAFAFIGIWQFSRIGKKSESSRPAGWNLAAVLLFSMVTVWLMTITGNTGGEIRHPEIISGYASASSATKSAGSSVGALGARIVSK